LGAERHRHRRDRRRRDFSREKDRAATARARTWRGGACHRNAPGPPRRGLANQCTERTAAGGYSTALGRAFDVCTHRDPGGRANAHTGPDRSTAGARPAATGNSRANGTCSAGAHTASSTAARGSIGRAAASCTITCARAHRARSGRRAGER
jgi:hypothetical protein